MSGGSFEEVQTTIGCTIVDIIGIPPGIYSYIIQLMPDYKKSIENYRCLNPPIQEEVKMEIIKWLMSESYILLQTAVGYVLFNADQKRGRGGLKVMPYKRNELVPMRSMTGHRV